jgi:hypothetical protein
MCSSDAGRLEGPATTRVGVYHCAYFEHRIQDQGRIALFAGLRFPAERLNRFKFTSRNLHRNQGFPPLAKCFHHLLEPRTGTAVSFPRIKSPGPNFDVRNARKKGQTNE